jgi:hypothetical protein
MDPQSKVDYSLIALEASMVMKKTSGSDSPLRQGAGKSLWTLPISGRRCEIGRVQKLFITMVASGVMCE